MYKLEYLPTARQDLIEIVRYISNELGNPEAAERITVKLTNAVSEARTFPYACPVYTPIRPLKHEYRKLVADNHLIFYWINEERKVIIVARVVYARRNYSSMLESEPHQGMR